MHMHMHTHTHTFAAALPAVEIYFARLITHLEVHTRGMPMPQMGF